VNDVLREIGAEGKPTIMVFNKLDRLADRAQFNSAREQFPNAVGISAKTGEGVEELLGEIGRQLRPIREFLELKIPHAEAAAMARLHAVAQIVEKSYRGAHARFKARIPPHLHAEFERFVVRDLDLDGAEK
jgi:GTP-binding protein HflX